MRAGPPRRRRGGKARFGHVLRVIVAPDAVLCTDGGNFLAAVAKALTLDINAYHGRFKE